MLLAVFVAPLLGLFAQVDWTDLSAVLKWLAGVGGPYVIGQVLSYLAENWPKWHTFPRWVKFLAPMLTSVLISLLATWLLTRADILVAMSPYFALVVGAVIAFVTYWGTQNGYMATKRAAYGYGPKLKEKEFQKNLDEMKENFIK